MAVLQIPHNAHTRAALADPLRDLDRRGGDPRAPLLRRARPGALLQPVAGLRGGGEADPPALVPRRHAGGPRRARAPADPR